jgi:hypothetical protein
MKGIFCFDPFDRLWDQLCSQRITEGNPLHVVERPFL